MASGAPGLITALGIDALWYLCHLDNMESILRAGILCHSEAHSKGLVRARINNVSVQEKRGLARCGPSKIVLHDNANLFFATHTPMLCVQSSRREVVHIQVDAAILTQAGVLFSNGNCAATATKIYDDLERLRDLDWPVIRSRCPPGPVWNDWEQRRAVDPEWKRKKSAEVLVPQCVPPARLRAIHVADETAAATCAAIVARVGVDIPMHVTPDLYRF